MNLKALSAKLGLSQTTVSRALNDYPEVNESTRMRVKAAALKYGYSANVRARSLATGRARTIGHVLGTEGDTEIVNPIFGDFLAGASESYSKNSYDLLISRIADTNYETAYKALIAKGNIDGIVLQSPLADEPRIEILKRLGIPFVVHGRSSYVSEDYAWVDVNNRRAFERATEFLIDLGHERIALINGQEKMDFALRRRLGYENALRNHNIDLDPELLFSSEMTEVFGHHVARDLLNSNDPPTAFLVSSLVSAMGVRRAVEERGLRIAHDISIIIHDDELSYLQNGQDVPIFTATRSSVREAGAIAGQLLIDIIENPDLPLEGVLLEAQLVVGRSTGPNMRVRKIENSG